MTESESSNGAAAMPAGISVEVFGRTDVGLVRDHNEDNLIIADLERQNRSIKPEVRNHIIGAKGSIFVVCDGMGGAAAGEVASQIGVDTIYEMMQQGDAPADDEELARRLDEAICEAGKRIFTAARLNRGQRGMGTTTTAAAMIGPRLVVGQVGDSRAHIVRKGQLVQITKDQSLVQQLIDAKQLTEEEAKNFDKSNIILQALGTTEEVHVDITSVVLRRGDYLVMCSDGLSGMVEPNAIRDAVLEKEVPIEICKRLTELACEGGGDDNITVIVAIFDGAELLRPSVDDMVEYRKFPFRRVTETTVRSAFPKQEGGPDATGAAPTAKSPDAAAPAGGPGKSRDEANKGTQQASRDESPPKESGGSGLIVGVIVALLAVAGIAAYFLVGEESTEVAAVPIVNPVVSQEPSSRVPSAVSTAGGAAATTNGGSKGEEPQKPTALEEPVLPPTPVDEILGENPEPTQVRKDGSKQPSQPSTSSGGDGWAVTEESATAKEPAPESPKETAKKKPKPPEEKKPPKVEVPDNPYE